jgi:trk system potassium uptake protein TrkA
VPREFAVIGLGVFGMYVSTSLVRLGQDVLAIDRDEERVRAAAEELPNVVRADGTDEAALRELQLDRLPCALVAIGAESMESSILATAVLRQIGVPQIVARSISSLHTRVLRAVGAHQVVRPEEDMGERLARRLAQPNVLERLELGPDVEVAELALPSEFVGKSLVEMDVRRKFSISVVAVRRGDRVLAALEGSERLEAGDILVIIGPPRSIGRFAAKA